VLRRFWAAVPLAAAPAVFAADTVSVVSVNARGNFHAGGVVLSPPEEKPPSEAREMVRVPVDDEGREIGVAA